MGLADIRATRQQAIEEPIGARVALASRSRASGARGSARPGVRRAVRSRASSRDRRSSSVALRAIIRYARHRHAAAGAFDLCRASADGSRSPTHVSDRADVEHEAGIRAGASRASASSTESKEIVVEAVSVEAVGGGAQASASRDAHDHARALPPPARRTRFFSGGQWHDAALYTRDQLSRRPQGAGPAIVIEPHQTVVVEHGWQAETHRARPSRAAPRQAARAHARDRHATPIR